MLETANAAKRELTFAMRNLDRFKCMQAVVEGNPKHVRASERLGLTTHQVRRLVRAALYGEGIQSLGSWKSARGMAWPRSVAPFSLGWSPSTLKPARQCATDRDSLTA